MLAFDTKYYGVCLSIRKGVKLAHKHILDVQGQWVEFCFNWFYGVNLFNHRSVSKLQTPFTA